ncbi:hypothetical protein PYCCODRAFT_1430054 [Trametes coccinea BRFM310]|uniref:Uncharacterized protein n=1 Tax=Trametes coccinea (strain BRFM310) TaxID=1353009 RepID=A0A1Y2J4W9_TRAC3|nr:hypothetical protein PYCCODRAFT_1430054 [Trametes coccinea BRFM310]
MSGSLFQNSFYVVNNINAILYGVELVLYFMTLRQVFRIRNRTRMDKFLIVFSTVLLVLNTIYWTTQAYFGQQMWVVHADYPGGMDAFLAAYVAVWYQTWGSAAVMVSNLMADALMMYRLYVIWDNALIVVFPAVIWLGSFASCLGLLYESGRPDGNYFVGISTKFGTAWNSLTFSFNVIVTSLICGRIIYIGRRLSFSDEGTRVYTGAVSIIIESALPFTIGSMAYVITYGIGSDIAVAFSCYSMFTAISPQLIALRVLMRRAWRKEQTADYLTTINFSDRTQSTKAHIDGTKGDFELEPQKKEDGASLNPSTSRETNLNIYAV